MRFWRGMMLITGASGFIGDAFLKNVVKNNWRIRVLTRNPGNWAPSNGIEVVKGDLANTVDWTDAVQGVDVVVHSAAEIKDARLMQSVNFQGPARLLRDAVNAGVRRWVQLSSVGNYGSVRSGLVKEDWPDNPSVGYEASKTDFDRLLKEASHTHGIEVCIVRPSNVYGPGMRNHSILQMLRAIQRNFFTFIGPKGSSANYVHIEDVVQALNLCVSHPKAANQTYIVSAWATMEDMVSGLAVGAGVKVPVRRIPLRLATWLAKAMSCWPSWPLTLRRVQAMSLRSLYSTEKIEEELGWKSTIPVKEGMYEYAKGLRE